MTYIKLGAVRAFPDAQQTKEQVDKVLDEAAAPFLRAGFKDSLMGEIADMVHPTKVLAVSPSDGTACTYFECGDMGSYVREACDGV